MKLSRLALTVALAPCVALAEQSLSLDQALRLSDTVVTANRDVQSRSESSAAVSVFTRQDIERLRPSSVIDLLDRVPGVQVTQSGGRGSLSSLFIRGTSNAQSLILIDGARVGSASVGGASLQYLSVEQIERVEVLRGSRSAIYGADAMGGVVQIFTRRGEEQGLAPYLRIAGGSQASWEHSLGVSGGNERTQFNLNASLQDTQGVDRTGPSYASDADHDAYRNRALSLNLHHQLNDTLKLGLSTIDQRGKTEYDNPFGRWDDSLLSSFPAKPYDHFTISSTSTYLDAQLSDAWNSRLELGHSEDRQENFDKLFPSSSVNNTYRDSVSWINSLTLGQGHTLRSGLEYLNDKLRSSSTLSGSNRDNQALFVQHSFLGEHFSSELGLRHDKNEQYGSENTFNGALSLPIDSANQLIWSYAEGFRAPTFSDLYWPVDYASWFMGNPALKPEKSRTYELQWRSLIGESTSLETSIYRTDFRDLIASTTDQATGLYTLENADRARIQGFEASLKQTLFGWQSNLSLSILDPRNRETGHTLANRARRTLSWDLDRQFGRIGIGASTKAVSSSYANATNTQKLPGYGLLDMRGSWQASRELTLDLTWNNVLDKDYSRAQYSYAGQNYGYSEMPSTIMFGLTWTPSL